MKVLRNEIEMLLPQLEEGTYYGMYKNFAYETAYHTSKLRENLINWYPFPSDASVLVISYGAGALIPYLCRNTHHVTVLEEKIENCVLIEKRCEGLSNLTIIQKDFMSYALEQQYDYILAIDYISAHLQDKMHTNFFEDFLIKTQRNLKESGKLLIAVNNSLGLRYLNGAYCYSENRRLFDCLKQPDFFTKAELEKTFQATGMHYFKFYYPFPDYVFPRSIYTDESIASLKFGHHYNDYHLDRYQFFDEFNMYHKLQDNGIVDKFSNSFFVELGMNRFDDNYIIYAKNQYFIDKKAKAVTILYTGDEKRAEKKALTRQARSYLSNFYKDSLKLNSTPHCFNYIKYSYDETSGILHMPYIEGVSVADQLEDRLQRFIKTNGDSRIYNEILDIFSALYSQMKKEAEKKKPEEIFSDEFQEYFGDVMIGRELYCLNSVTLDLHVDHLYPNEDGYDVIDLDPITFCPIPVDYLMWCLLEAWHYTHIYKNVFLEQFIDVEKMSNELGIHTENISVFKQWRRNVFNNPSAVSQIQPFYSRKFVPAFLSYDNIEEYGNIQNSDSRVMSAMKSSPKEAETFRMNKETPVILYGASAVGKLFYSILSQRGYHIAAFIDKRHDELSDIQGCPVIGINQTADFSDCIVIIAIKNVFEHETIAKQLYKRGCEKLIYRPQRIIKGEEDSALQIINDVYDEIERFKWIKDISVELNVDYGIPKTKGFPKIVLKDGAVVLAENNKVTAHIPVTNIYTAQQALLPDYPWAEKSIISLVPHTSLYKYLWDGGEDKTRWYIDFCSYGARNNNVDITPRWEQNLIDNRLTVLTAMKKSLEQDFAFFYRNPPEGLWNENLKYFNLNGGRHRAALFVYQGFFTMPLKIDAEDYNQYLNLSVLNEVEHYMQEHDIELLEAPVSHPYFLDIPSRRPQYYQCVIRPVMEYLSEKELEFQGVIDFTKTNFLISAEDCGELKRCLLKSGFSVTNLKEESEFEKLLDKLFYIDGSSIADTTRTCIFLDCSLPEKNVLENCKELDAHVDSAFILLDKQDVESVKKFLISDKNFKTVKIIKSCYWDSQSIVLLALEGER